MCWPIPFQPECTDSTATKRKDILKYTAQNMIMVKEIILHESLIEDIYILKFLLYTVHKYL